MPPRICLAGATPNSASYSLLSLLKSSSSQQHRSASILGALSDTKGAYNKKIRRGRGPASGKGKTSGRGHGGQKQHGKVPAGFNGGQSTDEKVAGKRGFVNQFSVDMAKVNLDKIQQWIDRGRIDPTKPVTLREIHKSRLTHGIKDGVKLLAKSANDLNTPIHITVSRASAAAIAAVEAVGGTVQTRYYTRASIKRILNGLTHPTLSLLSKPVFPTLPLQNPSSITPRSLAATPTTIEESTTITSEALAPPSILPIPNTVKLASTALKAALTEYRYRLPDPASRKDLEYYRDPAHRGYLSYQLKEHEGPSLFFKSPLAKKDISSRSKALADKSGAKAEQIVRGPKLW